MLFPAASGSGESVFEMLNTGAEDTVVVTAAPLKGPASLLVTLYVPLSMTVPLASGLFTLTTRVTDPEAAAGSSPMFHVTTPPASDPAFDADTKAVFPGTVSLITTPVASAFPVFE